MCHSVLYQQLSVWLLHGMLNDRYQEFFVQRATTSAESSNNKENEDELGLAGISSKQLQQVMVSRVAHGTL